MLVRTIEPRGAFGSSRRRRRDAAVRVVVPTAFILLLTIVGASIADRGIIVCGRSQEEVAKLEVTRFADDAYPQWLARFPDAPCTSLWALLEWTQKRDLADPWGTDYRVACDRDARRIRVVSAGPDRRFGTVDDIASVDR